ncbi:MAG TPA: DUF1566 domain-containing protein [Nitrospirae bacterium]|nr:DUF1566 domain-containing protein [Nitrospirota bacterium]
MKRATIFFITMLFVLVFAHSAKAALQDKGEGLIYDDDLGITWMQYANYADGTMTWDEAVDWVDGLVFQGYDDWRLPDTDTSCSGKDCTGSDMGHLFYMEGITSDSPGLFTDVKPNIYWSAIEDNLNESWRFNFKYGTQGTSDKSQKRYVWAVRYGESTPPVVPEPISSILFITGVLYSKLN